MGRPELEAAHEIAQAFLAATQPIEVYRVALVRIAPMVRADFAAVFLRDDAEPDRLRPVCVHGWPQASARYLGQLRIRVGLGPTGRAVAENAPVEVTDVFADAAMADWWEAARELNFASMITVPLATSRGVNGAVSFYFASPRTFTDDERRLLRLISEQLAATTLRARIVEELRLENERLRRELDRVSTMLRDADAMSRAHDQLVLTVARDLRRVLAERKPIDHAPRIVEDLAELASLRLGRLRISASPEDGVRIARLAAEAAGPAPAGAKLEIDAGESIVPIITDGPRTVHVLANMLADALRRTRRGRITLGVAPVRDDAGSWVEWTINARGVGLDSDDARVAGWSRLDAALATELVKALGGSISSATDAASGWTARLRVPARRAV
jgi:GAF domain-containing protein